MKSKPEIVKINKENWRQIVVDSLFNTLSLARSSKLLLKENMKDNKDVVFEQPHVAAGLYLFAIEEYGKAAVNYFEFFMPEHTLLYRWSDENPWIPKDYR